MTFDPKQSFYLNPYPDPGSQANADPEPNQQCWDSGSGGTMRFFASRILNNQTEETDPDPSVIKQKQFKKPLLPTFL